MATKKSQPSFKFPKGKVDISKIDNVLLKDKKDFKKFTVQDWGDTLMADKEIQNILMTDKANDVANKDERFNPANMGNIENIRLGEFFYDEEYQRLMEYANEKRLLTTFDIKFFTVVLCVKFTTKNKNFIKDKVVFHNTIDGWHHLLALYLHLRAGNIKGWDPEDWEDFKVPAQVWTTDDPTFPGLLALMTNGEGQKPWGGFEYMRIHSNNARLYPKNATKTDWLYYNQVMACINEGNSVPMNKNHKDANGKTKKKGVMTHIDAITQDSNKDISRLKFIMSQHEKYWATEDRSSAMFGFYGNIYDEAVRTKTDFKSQAFDDQMLAYNYIVQHVFVNLEGAMKAIAGKNGALTKLQTLSNQGWKAPSSDNALLAMVEIIYMDYLQGPSKISAARGSFVWTSTKKVQTNIVDALVKLPTVGAGFAQKISTL